MGVGEWSVARGAHATARGTHDDTRTQHTRRSRVRSGAGGEDESEEPKRIMVLGAARGGELMHSA